jgi:polar amino acid transport system permease protein
MGNILQQLSLHPPGWGSHLLWGLAESIQIAAGAFGIGVVIGIFGAHGKIYGGPLARDLLGIYTLLFRAVPELIMLLLLYYAFVDAINRTLAIVGFTGSIDFSGVTTGMLVLGVVQGAYATEVIRGAMLAVPYGQIEAARSFGMPTWLLMRRIYIPAMLPFAIPGLANLWLVATRSTALLAIIGFTELTQRSRQAAAATKAYFTFFIAAGALYLALALVSNILIRRLERRARRGLPQPLS